MEITEVRNNLIKGLNYTEEEIKFIDIRLDEIMDMERISVEELNDLCYANSCEMFQCIFDYKELNKNNF